MVNLDNLSLPCCHWAYQFYVDGQDLDLLWHQRSADVMIGIPSDMVLAALMLILVGNTTKLRPRNITMVFGDTHIYAEHEEGARQYLERPMHHAPKYECMANIWSFIPSDFKLINYKHEDPIRFELL